MNLKSLAKADARKLIDARKLEDIIIVRRDNLPEYAARFDVVFDKLTNKEFAPHKDDLAKYADKLAQKKSTHTGRNVAIIATLAVAAIIAHETGYDKQIKDKIVRKYQAFKNGPAPLETEKPAETEPVV